MTNKDFQEGFDRGFETAIELLKRSNELSAIEYLQNILNNLKEKMLGTKYDENGEIK